MSNLTGALGDFRGSQPSQRGEVKSIITNKARRGDRAATVASHPSATTPLALTLNSPRVICLGGITACTVTFPTASAAMVGESFEICNLSTATAVVNGSNVATLVAVKVMVVLTGAQDSPAWVTISKGAAAPAALA